MAVNAPLVILVALLINVTNCSTDSSFRIKCEDSTGGYTINIYYKFDTLEITHDGGLVVINLTTFPTQNISQKLRDNNLTLSSITIQNCTLPDGDSFGILFKHLGIENEILSFTGFNISPQNFSLDGRFSSGFEKLETLSLSENSFIKLNDSVFESLTELIGLHLNQNNITEVNQNVFKNLIKLKTLYLDFNELKSLSEGIFENQNELTFLSLQENRLTNLTKEMFRGLCSLRYLWLRGNAASVMDDFSQYLPRIEYILLGRGEIKVTYEISGNRSQKIIVYLEQVNVAGEIRLPGLTILDKASSVLLINCGISSLNVNSLKKLNSTMEIDLSSNNINSLVDGLFNGLKKLLLLNLSYNQLTKISGLVFQELENLNLIDLSGNVLTTIHPNAFDNNKRLVTIHLQNNQLEFKDEKTPFMHVYSLEFLDLSQNNLIRVPDFVELKKLKEVDLANNEISSVNFSEIRQYFVNLDANYETRPTFGDRNTRIHLNGNPLKCDCSMFDFLSGTDHEQLASVFSHRCNKMDFFSCNPKSYQSAQCLTGCTCKKMIDESTRHMKMSCKGKKLTELPKVQYLNDISIKLDISNNSLEELPKIDPKLNVTFIQASFNRISVIEKEKLPPSLRGLDLSHNQFRTIAPEVLIHLKNLKYLEIFFFKNNPLECYCSSEDTEKLIKFIDEKSSMTDLQNTKCNEQYDLSIKALQTVCTNEEISIQNNIIMISLASVTIVVIIFVVILLLLIKHHKFIKMWLYAHGCFLWWVDEEYVDREKVYDVFISYEHTNRMLAFRIMYALEKCNIFKVCLHERDFPGGARIEESVNNAVHNSRRTLVILSENYLKSVWCEHEFHLAWNRCVAEKRKLIIAVKDGNLGNVTDKTIRSYIETHTYIESGAEWFFERLIFRLPHKRTIKNIFPIREWDMIPLDVNESSF